MNPDEKRRRIKKILAELREGRKALKRFDLGDLGADTWGRLGDVAPRLCLEAASAHRHAEALWRELYNLSR